MRFVPVKDAEQQAVLMLHRARSLLVRQRTMLINALRAHLAEFGIVSPIVKLCRPRALVCCHLLRFFQIPAIGQVDGDPGCPEGMAADFGFDPGPPSSPADHVESILPIERPIREYTGLPIGRPKQRALLVLPETGRVDVAIEAVSHRRAAA
jgi:hypothetical protein